MNAGLRRIAIPAIEAAVVGISVIAAVVVTCVVIVLRRVEQAGALRTAAAPAPARDVIEAGIARKIAVRRTAAERPLPAATQRIHGTSHWPAGMAAERRADAPHPH